DNLGGVAGSGYTTQQTRTVRSYDDLGLETSSTQQVGVNSPLIYTTTISYDEKLRPDLVCQPRGTAAQFVRDDVGQQVLELSNGTQKQLIAYNDGQMTTATTDCPLVAGTTESATGTCPTLAADTASTSCTGNGYYSYSLHDGTGLEHGTTATG